MKIRPLADRVVIKKLEAEEKTASGIVLPGTAKEQPQMAEVIEVGPGGIVDGKEITMELKVGDKVIFQKYAGTEVKIEGNEYTILRQSDILAVVDFFQSLLSLEYHRISIISCIDRFLTLLILSLVLSSLFNSLINI